MIEDVRVYVYRGRAAEESWNLPKALEQYTLAVDEGMRLRLHGYTRSRELNELLAVALERLAGVLVESARIHEGLAHLDLARDLWIEIGAETRELDRISSKRARYVGYLRD
jgi:hypothetical protein